MKALINPNEPRETGYRVCQIQEKEFDVCEPLFWIDCDDTIIADLYWFDPSDNLFKEILIEKLNTNGIDQNNQPITTGTQTI